MSFRDYVNKLLDTPMIFINREGQTVSLNGKMTFKQFMNTGYEGFRANIEDWKLHANLYFPEVRLRNFIEIRNHDCVGGGLQYSIPAFYKGIMYNSDALNEAGKILGRYFYQEINELRYNVPKYGIEAKIRKQKVSDICKELINISYESLLKQGLDEEKFLEPIIELLNKNKTPADI
jgi:glutamate--cysteine ligase